MMAVLFWRMLRYRVAVMLWMFMLLGAAAYGGLTRFDAGYLWAALVLACCYVAATCFNDVADEAVDRVNHPRDQGRPLVSGDATPSQLRRLGWIAAGLAILASIPLGPAGVVVTLLSLVVAHTYSLPPARLSYRRWYLAAPVLSVGYVLVPFLLGTIAAGGRPDVLLCAGFMLLFGSRITLKDFRDRDGDAAYGKPTLLLRYGKQATCLVSAVTLAAGNIVLLAALRPGWPVAILLEVYVAAVAVMLYRLARTPDRRGEQIAIGIGARMGNGLLIGVLAVLMLAELDRLLVVASITAVFAISFVALVSRPEQVVIGYKG